MLVSRRKDFDAIIIETTGLVSFLSLILFSVLITCAGGPVPYRLHVQQQYTHSR